MFGLLIASCVASWFMPAQATASLRIVAPANGGVVVGRDVVVEAQSCRCKGSELTGHLDGRDIPLDWSRGPYRHQWLAHLRLPGTGSHVLELTGRCRATTRFLAFDRGAGAAGMAVATNFLRRHPTEKLGWDWGPGVFLYGLSKLIPGSPMLTQYYKTWSARGIAAPDHADACAPALGALALERETGDAIGHPLATEVANYLRTEPRNELGAIDHLGHWFFRFVFPPGIWVDSLQMTAVFAAQWGHDTGDERLRDFGAAQPLIYASVLQDPGTGLFRHAYDFRQHRSDREAVPHSDTFWLRGNGWVVASIVDILDELPRDHPSYDGLVRILNKVVDGLAPFQEPTGLWDSILNDPGLTYGETSGTSLAAYGIAKGVHRGWIPPDRLEIAKRAFAGVTSRLKPTNRMPGQVIPFLSMPGTSWSTHPGSRLNYRLVPTFADLNYGVGAYLMVASELANEEF